jgi:hypothetical protein
MKTYPIFRDNGSLRGFEISNTWLSFRSLFNILRSVAGVTEVQRIRLGDDRVSFLFLGVPCVVHEPFGDNGRYWIGAEEAANTLDITALHLAFQSHQGAFAQLRSRFSAAGRRA